MRDRNVMDRLRLQGNWFFPLLLRTIPFWGDMTPGVCIFSIALADASRELRLNGLIKRFPLPNDIIFFVVSSQMKNSYS